MAANQPKICKNHQTQSGIPGFIFSSEILCNKLLSFHDFSHRDDVNDAITGADKYN